MKLRIGIVGAGANTKLRHIPGFREIDDVEVVAVCNRSRESSEKAECEPVTHTSFESGVKYMEFTEAVLLSLRQGRLIDLPL